MTEALNKNDDGRGWGGGVAEGGASLQLTFIHAKKGTQRGVMVLWKCSGLFTTSYVQHTGG